MTRDTPALHQNGSPPVGETDVTGDSTPVTVTSGADNTVSPLTPQRLEVFEPTRGASSARNARRDFTPAATPSLLETGIEFTSRLDAGCDEVDKENPPSTSSGGRTPEVKRSAYVDALTKNVTLRKGDVTEATDQASTPADSNEEDTATVEQTRLRDGFGTIPGFTWAEEMAASYAELQNLRDGKVPDDDDLMATIGAIAQVASANRVVLPEGLEKTHPVVFRIVEDAAKRTGLVVVASNATKSHSANHQVWAVDKKERADALDKLPAAEKAAVYDVSGLVSVLKKTPNELYHSVGNKRIPIRGAMAACRLLATAAYRYLYDHNPADQQGIWSPTEKSCEATDTSLASVMGSKEAGVLLKDAVKKILNQQVRQTVESENTHALNKLSVWVDGVEEEVGARSGTLFVHSLQTVVEKDATYKVTDRATGRKITVKKDAYMKRRPLFNVKNQVLTIEESAALTLANEALNTVEPYVCPPSSEFKDLVAMKKAMFEGVHRLYDAVHPINRMLKIRKNSVRILAEEHARAGLAGRAPQKIEPTRADWEAASTKFVAEKTQTRLSEELLEALNRVTGVQAGDLIELRATMTLDAWMAVWVHTFSGEAGTPPLAQAPVKITDRPPREGPKKARPTKTRRAKAPRP